MQCLSALVVKLLLLIFSSEQKAFSVSNQAVKLELDFLNRACFAEFNTLTFLVIFINAFFFSMFFSYNFPVADIVKEILSANRPHFTNTKEVHTL